MQSKTSRFVLTALIYPRRSCRRDIMRAEARENMMMAVVRGCQTEERPNEVEKFSVLAWKVLEPWRAKLRSLGVYYTDITSNSPLNRLLCQFDQTRIPTQYSDVIESAASQHVGMMERRSRPPHPTRFLILSASSSRSCMPRILYAALTTSATHYTCKFEILVRNSPTLTGIDRVSIAVELECSSGVCNFRISRIRTLNQRPTQQMST